MVCYTPIRCYKGKLKPNGKRDIVFQLKDAESQVPDYELKLPCGKCIGCRLDKAKEWALRLMHEAEMWERNCFITLTYDDDHMPYNRSLVKRDFQLFMKRLRKLQDNIRFFHCGEYGSQLDRPHYHALLFNFDFDDKELFYERKGIKIYRSQILESLWEKGFSTIGAMNGKTAYYVARYSLKKVTGSGANEYYGDMEPEYCTMSRRPGIGRGWYDKYKKDVYPSGYCVSNGYKLTPPKYYDKLLEEEDPELLAKLKAQRAKMFSQIKIVKEEGKIKILDDNDSIRLAVKEKVKTANALKFNELENFAK